MADILDVYKGDPVMAPAFAGMVHWAIGEPEIRGAHEAETGAVLPPPARSGLDLMIDEATGVTEAYIMGFAQWAYVALWGDVGGSDA